MPSLYKYVQSVGGDQTMYGFAACVDSLCGIFFLPLYGRLADRYSPKLIFLVSFVIMGLGGVVYGLAATAGASAGPWVIIAGRFLIGSTSGLRAVGNGFIANYSPPESRTENLAIAQMIMRVAALVGPALNLLMLHMPQFHLGGSVPFDPLTWCGYFVTCLAAAYFLVVLFLFQDPGRDDDDSADSAGQRPARAQAKPKPKAVSLPEMFAHIRESRCWVNAHMAYINNFTGQMFTYYLCAARPPCRPPCRPCRPAVM